MVNCDWGWSELLPRVFGLSKEAVEVGRFVEAVVVHRVAMFGYLSVASPVAERVRRNAEIFSGLFDSEITIELFHTQGFLVWHAAAQQNTNIV